MIIRVSAKLAKKIHLTPSQSLPADDNAFADWSTHLFTADRTQYILITNTASLYSMVMFGKGITNDGQFLDRMTSYMGEFIRDDGFGFIYERLIVPSMERVSFSKALNRSVTGSMNDLVFMAKTRLVEGEVSPYDVSFWLNEVPMSYIKYGKSKDAFQSLSVG
ncbi:hypothetical protein HN588_04430 [Candidatus Bathyarchaeota archaeon]|mgnify:FL=1|jgi:hypothetical protein|nr:hypothetical protein [Candidatus Bathyarchaeota archaeon]